MDWLALAYIAEISRGDSKLNIPYSAIGMPKVDDTIQGHLLLMLDGEEI